MSRGSKFFNEVTTDETKKKEQVSGRPVGRSVELLEARNLKLAHRYYYYTRIIRYNYEDTLQALVNDFDLSASTITQLIPKIAEAVRELNRLKIKRNELKKIYPIYSWNHKQAPAPVAVQKEVFVLS